MAREPDVALLITASGSFADKHKLAHIKKICEHNILKVKTLFLEITTFLRQKSKNQSQIQGEDLFFRDHDVFEKKIKKSESVVNNINFTSQKKFAHEQISAHTHTAKNLRNIVGSDGNAFKNM